MISLSYKETRYLLTLVMSDKRRMEKLNQHAVSHGDDFYCPELHMANDIEKYLLDECSLKLLRLKN